MRKKLFRSKPVQTVLAVLLAGYISLVKRSTRWQVLGLETVEPIWAKGDGVIGALWHSRVLLSMAAWRMDAPPAKQPPAFLISLSPDGGFISQATKLLGAGVIRGSASNRKKTFKNKGGMAAFRQMMAHVQTGGCLAITPDGPRGPRMQASLGAVQLAAKTGAPIICLGCSTKLAKFFNSWDRFCLPFPFGRGVIVWAGPVRVPKNASDAVLEAKRLEMQTLIIQATQQADIACGHPPILPAEQDAP
ncbi:Protein of unknown function DUF374 [hydrothermal vent metagenome]|uniref:DUF374 domain-containing protein n=1 Tax=hydrothermal vent metagenome TaxID=652676 RepID=A0A3B0RDS7_9ZZZZ